MLHLIARKAPPPLHRLALRIGYRLRRVWWRMRRPTLRGVAVIARDAAGRVLLVRLSYGPAVWSLPAGGMGKAEDPASAAAREFGEELRCPLGELRLLKVEKVPLHGATDHLHLFTAPIAGDPRPDGREVVEARWFAPDALPDRLEKRVRSRVALLDQPPDLPALQAE